MSYPYEEIGIIVRNILGKEKGDIVEIVPVAEGGSQRLFYRIRFEGAESVIFLRYEGDRQENKYYADLADFLRKIGVSAPRMLRHDAVKNFLVMEDLGEKDLCRHRYEPWDVRRGYYFKTLSLAGRLHSFRSEEYFAALPAMMDAFSPELYRWEHDYFLENFVRALCRIELDSFEKETLKKEFDLLVERLLDVTPCLIHRDLQSQNIMIHNEEPVMIDFQGMRYGNPFYDLGSLLYDPYVSFTEKEREELLVYYCGLTEGKYGMYARLMLCRAAVQRLMQALGAYGFLGLKKGKRKFLDYVPSGLDNLIETSYCDDIRLPALRDLALRCRVAIQKTGFV